MPLQISNTNITHYFVIINMHVCTCVRVCMCVYVVNYVHTTVADPEGFLQFPRKPPLKVDCVRAGNFAEYET